MLNTDLLNSLKDLFGLIAALIAIAGVFGLKVQTPFKVARVIPDSPKIFRLLRLIQSTGKSHWYTIRNISIFVCILVLGYDVALVWALLSEGNQVVFSGWMIIILIVIIVFPIFSLIDDYQTELRLGRGERSRVFKWAEMEVVADYESLLSRCLQVVTEMGARITQYDVTKRAIRAELANNYLLIEIRPKRTGRYVVYVASDSMLPTVRIDFGINLKFVNEYVTRLIGYK